MRLAASRSLVSAAGLLAVASAGYSSPALAQELAGGAMVAPTVVERIPERWKDEDGLVVGQIAGTWQFGVATMGGKGLTTGVAVRGARPTGNGLFRGVVIFTRREGDVTLSGAYASVGGTDQRLPIGRTFEVRRAQITVLGLMYFQKQAGTREGYRILAFDNRDETMDYLRRTYPQLLAGHASAQVVLAPGDYLPMEKLAELRTAVATAEARRAKREGRFWVAGSAGTIAEVKVAGDSVDVLRFLPPVTYHEPMLNSWDAQGALTFSSATHRWHIVNDTVVELSPERDAKREAGR
jgi:hypothetical protein